MSAARTFTLAATVTVPADKADAVSYWITKALSEMAGEYVDMEMGDRDAWDVSYTVDGEGWSQGNNPAAPDADGFTRYRNPHRTEGA